MNVEMEKGVDAEVETLCLVHCLPFPSLVARSHYGDATWNGGFPPWFIILRVRIHMPSPCARKGGEGTRWTMEMACQSRRRRMMGHGKAAERSVWSSVPFGPCRSTAPCDRGDHRPHQKTPPPPIRSLFIHRAPFALDWMASSIAELSLRYRRLSMGRSARDGRWTVQTCRWSPFSVESVYSVLELFYSICIQPRLSPQPLSHLWPCNLATTPRSSPFHDESFHPYWLIRYLTFLCPKPLLGPLSQMEQYNAFQSPLQPR